MKKFLAFLLIPAIAIADGFNVSIENKLNTTNSVTTDMPYSGYLESLYVDVTGTTTGTLTVASSIGVTLLTATISADTLYAPRYITVNNTGTQLAAGTNDWAKYLLNSEKLTVTLSDTAPATNSYKIYFKLAK